MNKPLKLTLKFKWYDLINSGIKLEEYRDITPYYRSRITKYIEAIGRGETVYVTFYKAYAANRPQMTFEIESITENTGNPEWGAVPGTKYYCIRLGKRII